MIPEDLRQDQQALQIDDLLRDIGGAVKSGNQQYPDAFFLRGFEITSQDYRKNGFLDPSPTPRDFCNVERIEVLKGPASMLYGGGQPSGMIDLITKKPLDTAMYQGGVQFGSYNLERYTIDATGPIDTGKSLLYRINAAYEDDDSFRDFGFVERSFVSPSVTWVLDHDTTLNWEGEYSNDRRRLDTGLAAINGQLGTLPSSRFLGEPTDFQHYTDYRQTLMCTHRINEDWSWNLGGYSVFYGGPSSVTYPVAYVDGMIPPLGNDVFFRAGEHRPLAGELPIGDRQCFGQVLEWDGHAQRGAGHRAGLALGKRLPRGAVDSQRDGSDDVAGDRRRTSDLRQSELRPAQSRHAVSV